MSHKQRVALSIVVGLAVMGLGILLRSLAR